MEITSVRKLKRRANPVPCEAAVWVQLEESSDKQTRQGKIYRQLGFTDGVDRLTIRVWADHEMFERALALPIQHFVALEGQWIDRGQFGLEPVTWNYRDLTEQERSSLLEGPADLRAKQAVDYAFIEEMVTGLTDPRLRWLCEQFLSEFGGRFRRTAAAREYHHARRGGLVEHVAQMMRSSVALLSVYDHLNDDLVVAGVLFHDIGKLWENSYPKQGFSMPYQEVGELLSHIPLGIEIINRLWRDMLESEDAASWERLVPKNEDVRLHLMHLVASHHGTREFGSPVLPKTPEAMLLHFVDNIDAKLEMFAEGYEKSALVAKNIYERSRPLFHPLVRPLPRCESPAVDEGDAEETASLVSDGEGNQAPLVPHDDRSTGIGSFEDG
jgi:3'-5' exoribonuclease